MKRICLFFVLILLLAGCAKQAPPAPKPEVPPVQAETIIPEPEPAPQPEPVPEAKPEEPVIRQPSLPDLPDPVYCWGDTAVSRDGTVVLQVPDHSLTLCQDYVSGEPRGILSRFGYGMNACFNGLYDLEGTPVLTGTGFTHCGISGNLFWFGSFYDYTVIRLSDGQVLAEGIKTVYPYTDRVVLAPAFQRAAVTVLDSRTGEETARLESGFQISHAIYENDVIIGLVAKAPGNGSQMLISPDGKPMLGEFYSEIHDIQQNCAIVSTSEYGKTVRLAIDPDTRDVVFRADNQFTLLPQSALVWNGTDFNLVDYHHQRLCDTPLLDAAVYVWDGKAKYVIATALRDNRYCTLILNLDGTELAELPPEQSYQVVPLSPTAVAYTVYSGEGVMHQKAYLYNLETGKEQLLTEGTNLFVYQIETTGGHMICCEQDGNLLLFLNDGTLARDDLGRATYLGGDVFSCQEGLRCLDGSWLYKPE